MPAYFDNGLMVGETAWHGKGTVIGADDERRFSIADSIQLAGMNQRIELGKCFYVYGPNGEHCDEIPGTRSSLRVYQNGTVKPLGTVGDKYHALQPIEAFQWFQPWLDTREVAIETAGTLKGGKIDWVLARIMRDDLEIGGGDQIAKYLTLTTSHDGSEATRVGFTPIRIVCWNTLSAAHRDTASKLLKVRHTAGQHDALKTIRDTIDLIDQEFKATATQYCKLQSCGLSLVELRRYVKLVCEVDPDTPDKALGARKRTTIDRIVQLALNGKGQTGEMTAWAAYNGVTEYVTHHAGSDAEKRLVSNMTGAYSRMNRRALDLALQLSA